METIKKYVDKISQYYKIEAIILFGSYAKGTENDINTFKTKASIAKRTSLYKTVASYVQRLLQSKKE